MNLIMWNLISAGLIGNFLNFNIVTYMENERYKVLSGNDNSCLEIIQSKVTDIKIKVYDQHQNTFLPNPKELQLYAEDNGTTLIFETVDLSVKKGIDVFTAIKWYVRHRFNSNDMLIKHFEN
jgi:hypothetical protein